MTSNSNKAMDPGLAVLAREYVVVELLDGDPSPTIQVAGSLLVGGEDSPSLKILAGLPKTSPRTDTLIVLEAAAAELGLPTRALANWPEAFGDLILQSFLQGATPPDLAVRLLRVALEDVRDAEASESFDRVVGLGLVADEYPAQRDALLKEMRDASRAALSRDSASAWPESLERFPPL